MNLIFAGTPPFAVPSLEALLQAGHKILAVYTQPDRPAGRGRRLAESPVKQLARRHGLDVRQPENLRHSDAELRAAAPDAMIVIAYGVILSPAILAIPKYGCLNVHASLLPRWRGAAPIPRAIEAGDTESGVTLMQLDAGLDTGPILLKVPTPISDDDTAQTLHDRLAELGAQALSQVLAPWARGELKPQPQNESEACYAKKLRKEEAPLDWSQTAMVLHRKIRALNPWPVATTVWQGKILRVWEAQRSDLSAAGAPGTVAVVDAGGIHVATGHGLLALTRLQAEGGKVLAVADFLNGHRLRPGERLG
jgi:methionyl-tRNA formyltransferase